MFNSYGRFNLDKLFQGVIPTTLKAVLGAAITFAVFDVSERHLFLRDDHHNMIWELLCIKPIYELVIFYEYIA